MVETSGITEKKELNNRKNIALLINTFYQRIREDEMLGPIFNNIINDWPAHLERLTDFWETNLLFTRKYKGNPLRAHSEVDEKVDRIITMEHFGRWLQIWFSTIEDNFEGKNAEVAKQRARKMSTMMFLKIFESRSLNN